MRAGSSLCVTSAEGATTFPTKLLFRNVRDLTLGRPFCLTVHREWRIETRSESRLSQIVQIILKLFVDESVRRRYGMFVEGRQGRLRNSQMSVSTVMIGCFLWSPIESRRIVFRDCLEKSRFLRIIRFLVHTVTRLRIDRNRLKRNGTIDRFSSFPLLLTISFTSIDRYSLM